MYDRDPTITSVSGGRHGRIARDPVGADVGERLRTVRLSWSVELGATLFGDFTCLTNEALDAIRGPALIVSASHRAVKRWALAEASQTLACTTRRVTPSDTGSGRLLVVISAEYHWPDSRMRRRGDKWYPREELPMHRSWRFETPHLGHGDFSTGFRDLYSTILEEGWPLDAKQHAMLTRRAIGLRPGDGCLPMINMAISDRPWMNAK